MKTKKILKWVIAGLGALAAAIEVVSTYLFFLNLTKDSNEEAEQETEQEDESEA